ncbi:MAG TPA: hypothetical protein VGQ59_16025 [Cyclobacteriaceae bacterium]|jgi:hypothetical protein|nr:hypothetical protein [Cyclobacteriaceae bacterium]
MKTVKSVHLTSEINSGWRSLFYRFLFWLLLFAAAEVALAQNAKLETSEGLNEAVASYDANVRQSILIASQHPSVLLQLQKSQDQTMAAFQKTIGKFRQQKQEWFYTVTRYPELMHQLATLPAKQTKEAVYKLLPNQDPDLKEAAWKLYHNEKKNLIKLDKICMSANSEFEKSVSHLNEPARDAFRKLQNRPDVLTLLTNNIVLTIKLGERYKTNPSELNNQLAMLHDKLEIQSQQEAAAFKKQMENDPKAMKELKQASNAYKNNGYYNNNPYYYPYSYWFGYPYWYPYPMWYPAMYWYYPGFYFGVGGLYGFPSFGFTYWLYNGGYYMRYPHLYRGLSEYYQTNVVTRRVITPVNRGFVNVATTHYNPTNVRVSTSSPYSYRQQGSMLRTRSSFNNSFNSNYRGAPLGINGSRGGLIGGGPIGGGFHSHGRH